jgi:ammonia channel protein AmtB
MTKVILCTNLLIVTGLVAITAGASVLHPAAGLIIGGAACLSLAALMRPMPEERD